MLKVIHFDSGLDKDIVKRESNIYVKENVEEYMSKNKNISADVVTGFSCSKFTKEVIDNIEGLKAIVVRSIGTDNIEKEYCQKVGVKFSGIDYSRYNIAHHTWAFVLFATRSLDKCFNVVKGGDFCHEKIECKDLKTLTFGIIGLGKIGSEVAKLAKSFGVKVIAYDPVVRDEYKNLAHYNELDYVLSNSDIISLNCDANSTSVGMIDNRAMCLMKNGVILINTARGSVINENDLINNVNKFSYIFLDVINDERKFDSDSPLLKHSNIFITPHIAHKSPLTLEQRWKNTYTTIDNILGN